MSTVLAQCDVSSVIPASISTAATNANTVLIAGAVAIASAVLTAATATVVSVVSGLIEQSSVYSMNSSPESNTTKR